MMTPREFKEIRIRLCLSQTDLAYEMGYEHPSSISRKEKGERPITKRDERLLKSILERVPQ